MWTCLKSMKHSLHLNMKSGKAVNNTFIHFWSYKQFSKDTHSRVLLFLSVK